MVTTAMRRALAAAVAGLFLIAAAVLASAQDVKPELSRVRLAVGGKPALFYLPLTVTERLGCFRDAGLDVEISDFPGCAPALLAFLGGCSHLGPRRFPHTTRS